MAGYQPIYIKGMETGLVQERQDFILPDDAYPILENAYIWREKIKRKLGCKTLGRLRRKFSSVSIGLSSASVWNILTLYSTVVPPITVTSSAEIEPGSVVITIHAGPDIVFTDQGNGTLTSPTLGNSGTINYTNGDIALTHTAGGAFATIATFNYFPGIPVMGLRSRELNNINNEQTVAFDQTYAYIFSNGWQEFITGTTWTGLDYNFFWTTNYWVGDANQKIFWATNFSGITGDPIRYTNGTAWVNFSPQINAAGDTLNQCLAMLPFRGRLVTFNTLEGANLATSVGYTNRIRWASIGTPFTVVAPGVVSVVSPNAWRDDIRGKGGFLDIPTSEDIISVGFVRDNLVIYCERSTWQLRYTGRSISPFQIEKVNSELGAESTFSAVQFDTSLVGIGDKGIVECDSYKSERIDIKIPDLVFQFSNSGQGPQRIHGIRNFISRLAYWIYPYFPTGAVYPNRRLIYNYENDSWAVFTDSLTALGTFQPQGSERWLDYAGPEDTWANSNFPWVDNPLGIPDIVGGNQQGYVVYLDQKATNDATLFIQGITGHTTTSTEITSPSHNLQTGQVIQINGIPVGTPFASSLNGVNFGVVRLTSNTFTLRLYNPLDGIFNTPQLDSPATYVGGGEIAVRDNFRVVSKKFNFLDEGQNIQMGFIDVLMNSTTSGAISLNVYLDYTAIEDMAASGLTSAVNQYPQNSEDDTFFNQVVPTIIGNPTALPGSKYWQRVFCPVRGAFITLEWTLSGSQMNGIEQESDVQIDSQIVWVRKAGRQLPVGA